MEHKQCYEQLKLENQLCFPLYACSRKIVSQYTPYFKSLGLTYTQYIVCMVLWEEEQISVKELGEKLFLDSGTLTPVLKKMETAGYVTRHRSEEDERVVLVSITDQGRDLQEKVKNIPMHIAEHISLTPQEAEQLHSLLYKVLGQEG